MRPDEARYGMISMISIDKARKGKIRYDKYDSQDKAR